MDLPALGTLVMTAVSHAADYAAVLASGGGGTAGVNTTSFPNGTAGGGTASDDPDDKVRLAFPRGGPVLSARTKRRNRLIGIAVALIVCMLVYFEVHKVAAALWRLVSNTPKGSFASPTKIIELAGEVKRIADGQLLPVTLLLSTLYLTLQTFCIPGTIALNAILGALLGVQIGLPLCVALGTLGASCCFGLSSIVGSRLAAAADQRLMQSQGIPKLRAQVTKYRSDLLAYLLFLRLTPVLPNWLINLASPVVNVPLRQFALATFLGITPQTYLSVRFGTIANAGSVTSVVTWYDTLAIAAIGVVVVLVSRLRKRFAAPTTPE